MTPAQFWDIEMQNRRNTMQMQRDADIANLQQQQQMVSDIGSAIGQFAGIYAENKQLEAKASSYDDIGKILGTAMFSDNPDAMTAFSNLKKEKDPRKKVMGYETLFGLVGPMGNYMMATRNAGIRREQMGMQTQMPMQRAAATAAGNAAAGQSTVMPQSFQNINFGVVTD